MQFNTAYDYDLSHEFNNNDDFNQYLDDFTSEELELEGYSMNDDNFDFKCLNKHCDHRFTLQANILYHELFTAFSQSCDKCNKMNTIYKADLRFIYIDYKINELQTSLDMIASH